MPGLSIASGGTRRLHLLGAMASEDATRRKMAVEVMPSQCTTIANWIRFTDLNKDRSQNDCERFTGVHVLFKMLKAIPERFPIDPESEWAPRSPMEMQIHVIHSGLPPPKTD
jgi:hypothetical protein